MRPLKSYLLLLFLGTASLQSVPQGLYNNGTKLIFPSGIYFHLKSGDFTNTSTGSSDGTVTLGGSFYLLGDWINNSVTTMDLSGGTVLFNGSSVQEISGSEYTEFYNLSVESGAEVEVPAGHYLTVNNNLTIDGSLKLKSSSGVATASLIDGAKNGGTNSGNLTVERYLEGNNKYHFLSSPVHNGAFSSVYDTNNGGYNVYYYDETNTNSSQNFGWTRIFSGTLVDAKGYTAVYSGNTTREFSSTLNTASDINITVTNTSSGNSSSDGWNLIGNPFPSPFSASGFITDNTTINGTLNFWDDDGSQGSSYATSDYASYNGTGSASSTGGQKVTPNGIIAIGQAFFVKKTSVGSGTVTFKNSYRTHSTSSQFFIPDPINIQRFKLSISNSDSLYNEILIGFLAGATYGHDRLYDGEKLRGNPSIALYSINNNREYIIQGLPPLTKEEKIPVGLFVKNSGIYKFKAELFENFDVGTNIYLLDKLLNSCVNISETDSVEISLEEGTYNNRFSLVFKPGTNNIKEDETVNTVINPDVYVHGKNIIINSDKAISGQLSVYDMSGKKLLDRQLDNSFYEYIRFNEAKGYYILRINAKQYQYIKQILIK